MCVCVVCDTVLTCVLWGIMRTLSDEGALVKAAKELGVVFKARTPRSIIIEVVCTITIYLSLSLTHSFDCYILWVYTQDGKEEEYELLNLLEFNRYSTT